MVFTGITLATVIGTPLGTLLGQHLGWRMVFWLITFTQPAVWLTLGVATLGIGGLFAMGAAGFAVVPAFLSRLLDLAGRKSPLAAAVGGSATNLDTAAGSYLGSLTLTTGLGYTAPTWLGTAMAALALDQTIPALAHQEVGAETRGVRSRPTPAD